jgi:L-threonylcarbamoyladenylate synthase
VTARHISPADPGAVAAAAGCLASGGLVAFPTETVYGLGADAENSTAIAHLYAAKGRPRFNPLIAHVADIAGARRLAIFDNTAEKLAEAFWPGPVTLVLPKSPTCPVADLVTAGLDTIAVRLPDHPLARDLIAAFGHAVAAPSANRSGHVSPTTADHVMADLGSRIDIVLDGGPTQVGLESTIVACTGGKPMLLRPGGLAREAIEAVLGAPLAMPAATDATTSPMAPGMLKSHYAPRAQLRLNAREAANGEAVLAFGALPAGAQQAPAALNLSAGGDLTEAAANLFSHLRALDAAGVGVIAVAPIPRKGLGEAINDRLRRAAAPRPAS